ncbi:major facilitator superfamily domain-containing protein [Xylaria bambusicola]|uniref:major facilitator superfamily domain-containing protein n=1 Tax=Xylaria bambusicola TaxID=326684 RepID=UPI002008BDDE|nr:major facilitator superfamily domain-containing protein [Xylaria bambusicola]KAI0508297.1 major facilitator superfamily domain-containing protein [Xylaria bambusicola]
MANEATNSSHTPLLRSLSSSALSLSASDTSSSSSISDGSPNTNLRRRALALRSIAFVSSIVGALAAGSVTVFSLYGHLFQSRLHYTQFQINGIASAMNIAMYMPVPIIGYMCDRFGPGLLSLISAVLAGGGYALAAALYQKGVQEAENHVAGHKTTFAPMLFAFVAIGVGAASLYLGAVTTCAKNFGRGRYRGLMLVAPIAGFGLSGMIMSQAASRLLYEVQPDGTKGDVNVFHFFLVLSVLLVTVGILGSFTLRIVDEEDLIDGAVEELERSGLLDSSEVFRRRTDQSYGTLAQPQNLDEDDDNDVALDPSKDDGGDMYAKLKKSWLLNAETRRFLADPTMWLFAISFWLIIGPGESFINNLGTVIGTLTSPDHNSKPPSAATHVSIMATVSTVARLVVASLSDLLSPTPENQYVQTGSTHSLPNLRRKLQVSRVILYVISALTFSIGSLVLASGAVQEHANRFWIVSGSIGAGYGAVFSLTPIIITMIWGVENFGTNFGIIALTPAVGSVIWGVIYSAVYQAGAHKSALLGGGEAGDDVFCYGKQCYAATFWAMTVSIWVGAFMIIWAWKGKNGWSSRGIVV